MPGTVETVASFSIRRTACLDADGRPLGPLPEFAADTDFLARLYRGMVLTRIFDEKAVALQRTGRLGTFASSLGQEAVAVGAASAMRPEDVLLPSFRDQGAQFWRGGTPEECLLYWGGSERGSRSAAAPEDFPICIPVGTQFPHAVGVATAFALRRQPRVALVMGGDGATSRGDFAEALVFAGVWTLPVVFVIANNQWAISVPRSQQCAAQTLAQKAIAAGIEGAQVDGNDVIAVHHACDRALDRARRGGGATLIEAVTYRITDHTTADDARRYRDDAEVSASWKREPVARLRNYLVAQGAWAKPDEERVLAECRATVEAAAEAYLAAEPEPATAMFDDLYAALPEDLQAQRAAVRERADG
ncbi:pyruvate dehydrogenase (acetyl-transferring) E1 component subunit alpha [Rhodobacteraceae bacterium 2CG4]|uniref:Pyruvate dehydrogenase E1 component subunit alpha n=1 Tax=Halovulum marinum TaxID=2662447 RepID=A0A6L5YYJ5_9RHOB|nr:pyruvate dehydrogenase (acetyl-transferring) E1 component subunit alpha [Halovulum marinum]MSU89278.1 pyruvate dehydrogenase (acetyl-transferring) E1 component subunit alpha [Halovulum marinum]